MEEVDLSSLISTESKVIEEDTDFYAFNEAEEKLEDDQLMIENMTRKKQFRQISTGVRFTCGITLENSDLYCWGDLETTLYTEQSLYKGPFRQISAGKSGVCAIYDSNKPILCLGNAKAMVPSNHDVEFDQISVTNAMACGVAMENSQLFCYGAPKTLTDGISVDLEIA